MLAEGLKDLRGIRVMDLYEDRMVLTAESIDFGEYIMHSATFFCR